MTIDRDKLREITEKIQVGDTDEGADALAEIVEMVRTEERADARHAVRQELADIKVQQDNNAALDKFARKYKKLTADPVLTEASLHVLRDEISKDLRAAGMTDDELQSVQGDVARMGALHAKARLMGREGVRNADRLLDDVGGVIGEKFNIKPEGTGRTPEQYVRDLKRERGFKASDDDPVGRRDGSRAPNAGRLTADQEERTRRHVQQLRKARGFAPLE